MTNRKETIKWIALFVAIVLLFAGVGTSLYMIFGHKNAEPAQQEQVEQKDDEKPVENNGEESALVVSNVQEEAIRLMFASAQPKFLASTVVVPESVPVHSGGAESDEAVACISQNVTATITPATVVDKYITWSVAWDSSAALKKQDISQYVTVTQENEGDLTATINCFKSFKGSKIILTCTTRQGNKKATAEVQFQGVPSSMTINSPSGVSKTNLGAMNVDMLYVGSSYSLNLALDNIFHDVGTNFSDFTVTVSGVGSVTCGKFTRSPRGQGWSSHDTIVDFSTIASEFITGTVTNYTLTLNVTKSLYDYCESEETHYVEGNGQTTTYTNKLYSLNVDSNGNKPYFVITVRHKTLGFSAEYKCFIGEAVSNVAMSKSTITF